MPCQEEVQQHCKAQYSRPNGVDEQVATSKCWSIFAAYRLWNTLFRLTETTNATFQLDCTGL